MIQSGALFQQRRKVLLADTMAAVLGVVVDLHHDRQRPALQLARQALQRQRLAPTGKRLDASAQAHRAARLVALQGTDQMPVGGGQLGVLTLQILHPVVRELTLTNGPGGVQIGIAGGLGDRQQTHRRGAPAAARGGGVDALAHLVQAHAKAGHWIGGWVGVSHRGQGYDPPPSQHPDPMIIGVPKEIKTLEARVALTPGGAQALAAAGHSVLIEQRAGDGSGFEDQDYRAAGAELVQHPDEVWQRAELILKVKEPQPVEIARARPGQTLFTYFHFAADRALTEGMLATGAHCFAYETLEEEGRLPLLTPMSEVAGRMAVQEGAKYLEAPQGGRGVLLSGLPGVEPSHVTILGGGVVGTNAAWMAAGLGARVCILDLNLERLRYLEDVMPANVTTVFSTRPAILELLERTDLLIGAVLIPGARAPKLVTRADLRLMPKGSVVVDVAVDQGGCIETCKPTTHDNPTFVVEDVLHYCVANMPGAVPRTSTFGLTNATLPWTQRLARLGARGAVEESTQMATAANMLAGEITCQAVAEAFEMPWSPVLDVAAKL